MQSTIESTTLDFLHDLALNNNRDWFANNKDRYDRGLANFKAFVHELESELEKVDQIEHTKIYRIYRDIRFSPDKTPYKQHFSAAFTRAGKYRRGGFFISVNPLGAFVAGGFWSPEKKDLNYIREGIVTDASDLRKAITDKKFLKLFGSLDGNELKTAPRGYDKEHPDVDLLRKKQFIISKQLSKKEMLSPSFAKNATKTYEAMIPMFDAIRDFLIYDANGIERP